MYLHYSYSDTIVMAGSMVSTVGIHSHVTCGSGKLPPVWGKDYADVNLFAGNPSAQWEAPLSALPATPNATNHYPLRSQGLQEGV